MPNTVLRTTFALTALTAIGLCLAPSPGAAIEPEVAAVNEELADAVARGDAAAARAAVERGAYVNTITRRYGHRNNLCGAVLEHDVRAVRILLELGASPRVDCFLGDTPLSLAAVTKQAEMINLLLAHGASADVTDDHGFTPLGSALSGEGRNQDAARLLRRHGAGRGDIFDVYLALDAQGGISVPLADGHSTGALWGIRPEAAFMRPFASLGWGVYGEAVTRSFRDVSLGGGLLLVPVFWVVPSLGVHAHHDGESGWSPGMSAGLFLGRHLANAEQPPARFGGTPPKTEVTVKLDFGMRIEGRWGKAASDRSIGVMLQMDLNYLWVLPYQFLGALALH